MPRYNHAFDIAFSVSNGSEDSATADELRAAIKDRLNSIDDDELLEATGAPFDTYQEEDLPQVKEITYSITLRYEANEPNMPICEKSAEEDLFHSIEHMRQEGALSVRNSNISTAYLTINSHDSIVIKEP